MGGGGEIIQLVKEQFNALRGIFIAPLLAGITEFIIINFHPKFCS